MSISSLLVPVGLEARDEKILEYVCGLGSQAVRKVIVATAVNASGVEAPIIAAEVDRARDRLVQMVDVLKPCGLAYEVRVVTGDMPEAILALAEATDVDVICCGTEGKSAVDALFTQSMSERLFASGKIRTMTVRYDQLAATKDPRTLSQNFARRLVVPTDFSTSATRAWLSAINRPIDAIGEVIALHVLPHDAKNSDRREAEVLLDGILDMAREHRVPARAEIRYGVDPAETVLEFLNEVEATGVITGMTGRGRLLWQVSEVMNEDGTMAPRELGALSLRLLREAPCPVVVQP
jgi:nucleotide-binding universal stress UspA family protein